ncbi:MAG: class I SAM-dependent methyltransferase [Lachnospiraceae bacterium]|nr:class I SAM-dependent methyltransferase [Lachnospiraceae bacterium]
MKETVVVCDNSEYLTQAVACAEKAGAKLMTHIDAKSDMGDKLILRFGPDGVTLTGAGGTMRGDFASMLPRLKTGNMQHELLVKAVRIKGCIPKVMDATAGMGEDSLILAAAGFDVTMYEYNPIIAALLADAMKRAVNDTQLCNIVSRMHLNCADSTEAMKNSGGAYDVILLDPMFPDRKKSALVKKKFQILHDVERPCLHERELLEAALMAKAKKTVIKRPVKGAYLAGIKPDYSLAGKVIRFDVISRKDI